MIKSFELRVAELMCSRICHDLISPIGAANNGLELVSDGNEVLSKDVIELINKSSKQALHRLSFYRLAFGSTSNRARIALIKIYDLLEKNATDNKNRINWTLDPQESSIEISGEMAKLVLNLFFIAFECLPRGGMVTLETPNSILSETIRIKASGPKCLLSDEVRAGLNSDLSIDQLNVKNISAYLVSSITTCQGKALEIYQEDADTIGFSVG